MATWISVAVFDYRVIFRGVIVNIRGVHAVVNIMACYLRVEKNIKFNKDFEHGFGRSQIPCTDPIWTITWWSLSISDWRGSRTGLWFLIYNKEQTNIKIESCLCQTNSRWFFDIISTFYRNIKTILTCIWLLLQLIKELCLTTKLSRISRSSFYDQCFWSTLHCSWNLVFVSKK